MVSEIIWIPITKELPTESEGTVLVLMPNKYPYNMMEPHPKAKHDRRIQTALYSEHSKMWYYGSFCEVRDDDPIAWARFPEVKDIND